MFSMRGLRDPRIRFESGDFEKYPELIGERLSYATPAGIGYWKRGSALLLWRFIPMALAVVNICTPLMRVYLVLMDGFIEFNEDSIKTSLLNKELLLQFLQNVTF